MGAILSHPQRTLRASQDGEEGYEVERVDIDRLAEDARQAVRAAGDGPERVVDLLAERVPHYSWVGIYWIEGDDLVLGPWRGPHATEHTRIPIGEGVCGAAAASGRTEVVDDVSEDDRYLECFPSTSAEIVVPIRTPSGDVVGEIDIDSDQHAAFGVDDVALLEDVAAELGARFGEVGSS